MNSNPKSSGRQLHQRLPTHVKMAQTVSETSSTLMPPPSYRSPCNSSAHQPNDKPKSPMRTLDPPPSQQQQSLLTSVPASKPRGSLKQRTSRQDSTLLSNYNQKPVSVANFLSPTRSSLAMQVKPLFANREKTANNHARQSCSFTKNSTRNNKGSTTRSSKLNLRPQGLTHNPPNSSTFNSWTEEDSDSYDQPPMMSSDQGSTPNNQVQPYSAANSQSKKVFQIKAIATAQEAQMTQAEKKQQTCQIEQQKHSNSTFSHEQQQQQMLIKQYQDEDSCEVEQMYTTEPVAQELPMQAKKIKSCAYRKTSAQVVRHQDNRIRDNSRTTNQSSAYNAALSIQENIMSPAVQAQSSLFNLIKTHKNTSSFSKQQTLSVLSHSSIGPEQRRRRTTNNNTCSSILLNKFSHLRASSIGSSCKSGSEIASSQNNQDTGASQATKRLKKKVVRHQPLIGSLENSCERDPGFCTLNSRVCQSKETQSYAVSTRDKNRTNVISQQTAKNRLGSKEQITLIQNKAKQIHAANKSPHARAKQYTRNTMITSPVRPQTQTYQSGVLHQKQRKTSAKNTSTCGNTNTQQKNSGAYVTLQSNNLPTSSTLNSLAATSTTKSPNMFQQYKTISNPLSSMNSLSLKNFVDSYQQNNEKQHSNQVVLRGSKIRSHRGQMAVACPPDISLNSTIVKPKDARHASSQSRAALKKRRSQEDSSTRRLITPGVGSPTNHLPQNQPQQEPQVKKCQLNKGIRSLLQKSKSQSRMASRQPLSDVSNNTGPGGIVMSTLEDTAEDDPDTKQECLLQTSQYNAEEQETTRIDILANANNYTEEDSIPQERPQVNQAPRGDNTPLSDTYVTGTHIGTCKQSPLHLMIPSPLEQKMTNDQAPNSISTKKAVTGKNLSQKSSAQTTSGANYLTRRTTPQDVDSTINWQNLSSHPASSKTFYTTTTSLGGAGFGNDSTPSLHLHQQDIIPPTNASPLETPPVPQEYSKHAIKHQRSSLNSSNQNPIVEQHQAPNQNEDEVSLDHSDQVRLIYHTIQHKRESDQQTEKQNMLITNHYMPEKLILQNNRRKRSQRVRQNGQQQSQTSAQSYLQQQPPVVTLNLADTLQKKKRQVIPQVLITKLEESTASAKREVEQTQGQLEENCFQIVEQQPLQLQQCASQVSFAAGAENCQGGMTMQFMDEAEGQKARTPDMPEQALQKPLSHQLFSDLYDQDEQENLISIQNDHQNNSNDQQQLTSQVKKQDEKQQSDLLPNFYPNCPKQRPMEKDEVDDDQVPGISFNDILQVRDREISTKSPEPCIIATLRMPSSELTNNDSSCILSSSRQSAPRVSILDRNTASQPVTPLTNDTPYQQIKSIKKQVPERLEERTSCMVKSKSHMRVDQFLTPGGKRNNALTSKKLSRNSACMSPTGQLKALINRDSNQQCNTMTALTKRTKQMPALKTRNQSSASVKTRGLSKAKQTAEDNQPKTQVPSVRQSLQKSHSQINQGSRQNGLHQKLFQVSKNQPLTPQKQDLSISRRMANDTQSKLMRRMRSQDRLSQNNDNVSQTRQNRSPGAKSGVSGGNLSVHQPSMFVLRSTKKLTQFREFAITPTGNQSGSCGGNAFISPLKLKKLEKKHGVSLLGKEPTTNNEDDNQDCEDQKVVSLTEKHQNLLQDNEAMDAYMKDLCNKYF